MAGTKKRGQTHEIASASMSGGGFFTVEMKPPNSLVEWRSIPDFEDYEVSNYGEIRRVVSKGRYKAGLHLIPYKAGSKKEYLYLTLCKNGKQKKTAVHRIVALAFYGPPPTPDHEVAHYDGNSLNNYFKNLRWATPSENARDRVRHGNFKPCHKCGSLHGRAKITEDDVRVIRQAYKGQYGFLSEYGRKYGLNPSTVQSIVRREIWREAL
jgi:hypothetical protein